LIKESSMGKLMKDELFEAQLLRAMGYAPYGAADMGECLATAGRISGTELDQWHDEWFNTANRPQQLRLEQLVLHQFAHARFLDQ
jgi:hypothetical protein